MWFGQLLAAFFKITFHVFKLKEIDLVRGEKAVLEAPDVWLCFSIQQLAKFSLPVIIKLIVH